MVDNAGKPKQIGPSMDKDPLRMPPHASAPERQSASEHAALFDTNGEESSSIRSSRLPGFYALPVSERLRIAQSFAGLTDAEADSLHRFGALTAELTDVFIENAIGAFNLPLGIATNFRVNGRDLLVPMAVEETSVLAAASHGAKLARAGGGFTASSTDPVMTGQIQLLLREPCDFETILNERRESLIEYSNRGHEKLVARGGGAKDLTWRHVEAIQSLIVHLHVDVRDAMGANIVNTMCEKVSTMLYELLPCDMGLRILTNLSDRRMTTVTCRVPAQAFDSREFDGRQVVERIVMAYQFAAHDVYRATTNNKGVMNGIDPVLIATGNDWRAVEAGAHAYCARDGGYKPMATWTRNAAHDLLGTLSLPMAVGTVGGVTKLHPSAQAALKLLGSPNARELAEIVTAVGLAQNLSALRALASEGIQRGHMSLHKSNLDLLQRRGATKS